MDRNRDMVRRYEEQTLQQKEMNRELSNLRQQLFGFKQGTWNVYLFLFYYFVLLFCCFAEETSRLHHKKVFEEREEKKIF